MSASESPSSSKSTAVGYAVLALALVGLVPMAVLTDGIGVSGDSLWHFFYAQDSWQHPEYFFHHWAKPWFTLLASPFAQLGFQGIKLFNVLVSIIAALLAWKTAQRLGMRNSVLAAVLVLSTPMLLTLTGTGLTEPLFACWLILAVYLAASERFLLSALVLSLLPFVRSEGLIFIGVFALYFVMKRQYKALPLLLAGHVAYGIAGLPFHESMWWTISGNPYVGKVAYGEGNWYDFAVKLYYVLGIPAFALLALGLYPATRWLLKIRQVPEKAILVFLGFGGLVVAHSIMWAFGWFHSMGLARVLVGVVPLIAIIALAGINWFQAILQPRARIITNVLGVAVLAYLIVFPFTPNPAAINFETAFTLPNGYEDFEAAAERVKRDFPNHMLGTYSPQLLYAYGADVGDTTLLKPPTALVQEVITGPAVVVWDPYFSVLEGGLQPEHFLPEKGWTKVAMFPETGTPHLYLFERPN